MLTESWIGGVLKVCIYRELSRHRVEQTNQKAGKQTAETAVTATEPYQDRYTEKIL